MFSPKHHPSLPSRAVHSLSDPATVRNDIAFVVGLVGLIVGVVAPAWHMPVIPDVALLAVSALLAAAVRVVHTLVDGHGVTADVEYLRGEIPHISDAVATLLPFLRDEFPSLRPLISQAAADAAEAKHIASNAVDQVSTLPASQAEAVRQAIEPIRQLLATGTAPTPAVAPAVAAAAAVAPATAAEVLSQGISTAPPTIA